MKAQVNAIISPDVIDLDNGQPGDSSSFGVYVQLLTSEAGIGGGEAFGFMLAAPTWLSRVVNADGPMSTRHFVIVDAWDWSVIRPFLVGLIEQREAPTWVELAEGLSRLAQWEFEDYRELGEPERPEVAPAGESMSATIKGWTSPDVDLDVWDPTDTDNLGVTLDLLIGNTSTDDAARFRVVVATPDWLAERAKAGPIIGWGMVIVSRWDWKVVADFLDSVIGREWGRSWEELVERLGRIGKPVAACD